MDEINEQELRKTLGLIMKKELENKVECRDKIIIEVTDGQEFEINVKKIEGKNDFLDSETDKRKKITLTNYEHLRGFLFFIFEIDYYTEVDYVENGLMLDFYDENLKFLIEIKPTET